MSMLDKRKKKKYRERELGWVKWFGIALALFTAAVFIMEIVQMAQMG